MVVIAAVDRSDRAQTVVAEAATLAEAFDDTIHVVHVMTSAEFVRLGSTRAEQGDHVDMDEVRAAAADVAADAATSLSTPHEVVGLVGDPATKVVDYADDQDARYVVIAGRKRSPAGKAIFGSVSQSILLSTDRPVVSVLSS